MHIRHEQNAAGKDNVKMTEYYEECPFDPDEMSPYTFSMEDVYNLNQIELKLYEASIHMNANEKRALRRWVDSGHSVSEHPGSEYISVGAMWPPPDFLTVYRMDREIRKAIKGMSKEEKAAFLNDYAGLGIRTPEQEAEAVAKRFPPPYTVKHIHKIERELFFMWDYLFTHKQWADLQELSKYVEDHRDVEVPYEW